MSFLSPVPGEKICADITGGYASLTPGYYLKTRSGLIKWSRAYTALHWIKNPRRVDRRGFCFWLALLAGARLRHGTLAGGLRFFFF